MKKLFLVLLVLIAAGVWAAPQPEAQGEITLLATPLAKLANGFSQYQYAIDKLKADYPQVTVTILETPANAIKEAMTTALASGQAPNVYIDYIGRVSTYLVPEYALDLTGKVRDLNQYYDLGPFTKSGKVLGLPGPGGAQGMAVNMDLMREIGFTPAFDWTVDDFLQMCELIKQKYGGKKWGTGMFAGNQSGDYLINNWFASAGARYYNPGDYTHTVIAETGGAKVYEFFQYLMRQGYIRQDASTQVDDDYVIDWARGNLGATAMYPGWINVYFDVVIKNGDIKEPFEVRFFPFPKGPGVDKVPTYTSISAVVVYESGTLKDEWAARFAEYLNDGYVQTQQTQGLVLPSRKDAGLMTTDPWVIQTQDILSQNGTVDQGVTNDFFQATRVLHFPILQKVLDLKVTPDAAIEEYAAAMDKVLAEY